MIKTTKKGMSIMKKLLMNNKKNNKGFTLVELIVVLVILAILAAILVPALLGYIDRAKQQQIVLNAKSCLTAAQAEFSSMYAKDQTTIKDANKTSILQTADVESVCQALQVGCQSDTMTASTRDGYKINYVYYKEGGKEIWYDGSSWVEAKPDGAPSTPYTIK
jgi:prepilin-type N-terminal cleavage/methylation domain-containing protein